MAGEHCKWEVDVNEPGDAVLMEFSELSDKGVEAYVTAMPPYHAISFAEAIIHNARRIMSANPVLEVD